VSPDLQAVKVALSRRYLGKAGIHALGVRPSANAISVFMAPGSREKYKQVLDELQKEAHPFDVLFTEEEPPDLASQGE
jgi:hypothetical protein